MNKILLFAVLLALFCACKKDKTPEPMDTDIVPASDFALAETFINEVLIIADQAMLLDSLENFKIASACAMSVYDTLANEKVVTIDFGDENCLGKDGRNRRGKIIVEFSGNYYAVNGEKKILLTDYYVDDYQLAGVANITNKAANATGNVNWDYNFNTNVVVPANGGTVILKGTRNKEWIEGDTTTTMIDDVYLFNNRDIYRTNGCGHFF